MAEIIRLRSYKTYLNDGKSWSEFGCKEKNEVFVAVILGVEPRTITSEEDFLKLDDIILDMAAHIKKNRAAKKKAAPKKKGRQRPDKPLLAP